MLFYIFTYMIQYYDIKNTLFTIYSIVIIINSKIYFEKLE